MEGVNMEPGLCRYLEKEYNFEIEKLRWLRGAMKVETDKGIFVLKKFPGSEEEILFVTKIVEHLIMLGFGKIAPVFKQKEGYNYCRFKEHRYYLQHFIMGRESDFQETGDIALLIDTLAGLHQLSHSIFIPGPASRDNRFCWPELLTQRLQQILAIEKWVLAKKQKDDFDKLFLKWAGYFVKESVDTLLLLAESSYLVVSQDYQSRGCFCHHDLVHHNVIINGSEAYLIDFDNCLLDIRVHDLVNLLNYVLKENQWNSDMGLKMIERYDRIYPLTKEEFNLLGILLNYPIAIWLEVYWHYCRRKFDDKISMKRLQGNIDLQFSRRKFLDQLLL